jgi:hypothetical protein
LNSRELRTEIYRYINYVIYDLINEYGMEEDEAEKILKQSGFLKLIEDFPNQVLHYNTEYWAEQLYSNHSTYIYA